MFNQEQEHWDYEMGRQSEAQMCYEEAQQERAKRDERWTAETLTKGGWFVVCSVQEWFCKATDAFVGEYINVVSVCDKLADAEKIAAQHPANFDCEDRGWFVYQLPKPVEVQAPAVEEDDIPF